MLADIKKKGMTVFELNTEEIAKLRDRSTSEVEVRVPRREHELAGALEAHVAPRTWVGGGVARRSIAYEPGFTFGDADLSGEQVAARDKHQGGKQSCSNVTVHRRYYSSPQTRP